MSAPFRELFVELPAAVFEVLAGAARVAVTNAACVAMRTGTERPPPALAFATSQSGGRALAKSLGLDGFTLVRVAGAPVFEITAFRRCGHQGRTIIDGFVFYRSSDPRDAIEAIQDAVGAMRRSCTCLEQEPPA